MLNANGVTTVRPRIPVMSAAQPMLGERTDPFSREPRRSRGLMESGNYRQLTVLRLTGENVGLLVHRIRLSRLWVRVPARGGGVGTG